MSDSLRILRISTDTYPEILGGGALHAHEMSKLQVDMGHEVTLLTSDHGDHNAPRKEVCSGYTLRRYREIGRPFQNSITPRMAIGIWRLADSHDIIHAHSHLYFSSNIAAAFSRLDNTPFVLTNHGLYSQSAPDFVQNVFIETIAKITFNSSDRILCYTETDRNRLRGRGVSAPISVIHNGVDCETFTPTAGRDRKRRVLFVGRLNETKGPHRLVEAFARLVGDIPNATLTFVGHGPLEDRLKKLVQDYGIGDHVGFKGRLPNEELPKLYAESTVFALPSDAEGLPRTVLESLACETPVVTSNLSQIESLVDGVGETFPRGSVDELETTLRGLLLDPDRCRKLGEQGREKVVENYSWADTVRKTTAIYNELLN